jgi:hypothetical protein
MRLYEPAWIRLKSLANPKIFSASVSIILYAKPELHQRIFKAITKEKDMDKLFKLEQLELGIKWSLKHSNVANDPSRLIITLYKDSTQVSIQEI